MTRHDRSARPHAPSRDDDPVATARELFSRRDLNARGMSRYDIDRAVSVATLTRVGRDAYVLGGPAETARQALVERSLAAMRRVDDGTVLSHASAAAVHGLPLWGLPTHIATASRHRPGHGRQDSGEMRTFSAPLDGAVTRVHGIPVTTPARTAVDIAREYRLDPAVCVADIALHRELATEAGLAHHVDLAAGRHGVGRARAMVALVEPAIESPLETRSRLAFGRAGLPEAEANVEIYDGDGVLLARPDFLWREWRLIGEGDGFEKYTLGGTDKESLLAAIKSEKYRENRLMAQGFVIIRWTWSDLQHPRVLAARVRAALLRQQAAGFGPAVGRLAG